MAGTTSIHQQILNSGQRPEITVPRISVAPSLRADPNDPAWNEAAVITELALSLGPDGEGLQPQPTELRLAWDATALYLRFHCQDDDIYAPHTGRDAKHHQGDVVSVFIDPIGDARQWYEMQVSLSNQVLDKMYLLTAEPKHRPDLLVDFDLMSRELWEFVEWDMEDLHTAAALTDDGWLVELRIPAEALMRRHGEAELRPISLHANFLRYDWLAGVDGGLHKHGRRLVATNWAPVRYGQPHVSPAAMGRLHLAE